MDSRMYSFAVIGALWEKGEQKAGANAQVVAASPEEAIEAAKMIVDPKGILQDWDIASAAEMTMKDSTDWAKWHKKSSGPDGEGS